MASFSDYDSPMPEIMSWSDIDRNKLTMQSAAQRRFLDMTKTFDEKLAAVEDNRFEKLANINDYNIDVKPSEIVDPDTLKANVGGQDYRIRLESGTPLWFDAIDKPDTLFGRDPHSTKSPESIRKQLIQVSRMVNKPVWELTDDDINQVRNWQSTDFFRRLIDPNFKFQKFDPNQRYEDATGAIENLTLKGKVLGKDDRGRLIMDILNPYTKSSLGFDLASNPYTNSYFDETLTENSFANIRRQQNYDLARKTPLEVLENYRREHDKDSRLGESLDLATSGLYQFGARWLKSIPGFDNKYWEKVASSDTGKRWADWFAGVSPKTREEYTASGARIQQLVEEGKFDEAAVEAASNLDRFVAESAVQMGLLATGMWATGGLASLGVAGRLAHLGLGAVPVALDKVFQDAIDFKKNNGREMTKGEYARTFAGALISTVPDELLFGMFSKTTGGLLSKFVKRGLQATGTKIAKDSSDIALKALGKPLAAAATEGGQEMLESGWDAASSAKQNDDFWTEILPREMTSTENQTAGLIGFMMGGALGSAGSALDFSIENKLNNVNTKQQQKFEQNRTVNTPAGTPANTQISKEALGRMSKIDVQPGQSIETSKAALDALNKEDNYLLNGKAYEEKYKKTAQANLNIVTEMYKKGASDEEIQKETGKTRQEAFSDFAQTYGSGYNSQYAYEHNTKYTKAENATMEKELLAIAKGLGLTTEEAKKTLKEVKEDIRRGPYGYETYGKQIQKGYDILRNNPDLSDDEKLDVQNTIKGYAHKLLNLYGYQTAKLAAFAEQYDLIDEGKKAVAEVKYPNRQGSFKLEGYWLSSQTFDSKKGAHGVVQDIYDSIKEMQNILDNVDIMSNEDRDAFLKSYNESSAPFKVDATEADVLYNRIRSAADRIVERGSAELAPVSQITSRDSANTIGRLQNMLKLEDDDKEGTKEYTNYRRWFFKVLREQSEAYDKINEFIDTNKTLSDERKTQLREKLADLKDALDKSEARRTQDDVDRSAVVTRAKTAINTVTADFLKPYAYRKGKDTPEEWTRKHKYLTDIINALNNTRQPDGSIKQGLITQLSRLATNSVEDRKLLADLKNLVTKVTDLRRDNEMAYKKDHGKKKASRAKSTKGTVVVDNKITIDPAEAEKIKNSSPEALIRTLNTLTRDMDDNKSEQDALKEEGKVDASLKEEMTRFYLKYKLAHETLASKNKAESYDPNILSKYDNYKLKDEEVVSSQTTSTTTSSTTTVTETSNKPASKQAIKGEISEAYKKIFDKMYKDKDIEGLKDYERQYDENIRKYQPGTQEYVNAYTTRSYITNYIKELTKPQKTTNFKEKVTNLINNEWDKVYNTQKYENTEVIDLHNDKTHGKQNKWLDEAKTIYYVYGGRNGTNSKDTYIGNKFPLSSNPTEDERKKSIQDCWNNPEWVDNVEKLISELKQLKKENPSLNKIELGCWCAPKPCHLNLVARLVQDEVFGQSQTSAKPSATDAVSEPVKASQSEAKGQDDESQRKTSETSPTASQEASEESKGEGYVLHSGGAKGSDSAWSDIAEEKGLKITSNHYYYGDQTPKGNVALTKEQYNEGLQHVLEAEKTLNKHPKSQKVKNLLARNWFQVKNADAVFAIAESFTDSSKRIVNGGTGWAVQMAIDNNKPVHVFNTEDSKWYKYNTTSKKFEVYPEGQVPTLTKNFAGIGSRFKSLNYILPNNARKAIEDVYETTFGKSEKSIQDGIPQNQPKTSKAILFNSKSENYNFLSNFYPVEINYKGHKYPSVEHAFQAAKTDNENEKKQFYVKEEGGAGLTALEAKRAGKKVTLRKDWENVKLDILSTLLSLKFFPVVSSKNKASELFEKLDSNLLYEATGYDEFYGVNPKTLEGANALGELLMRKAEAIYNKPIPEEYGPLRSGTEFDENMIKKTLGSDGAKKLIADIKAGKGRTVNKVTGESYNDIFNAKIQVLGQAIRKAKTPSSISEETLTLLKEAVNLAQNLNKNVYRGSKVLNSAINGIVRYVSRIPGVSESDFKVLQPDASNTPENAPRIDQNAQDGKTSMETQQMPENGAEGPKSGSQEKGYQPSEEDREIMEELGLDDSVFTTEPKLGDFKIKTASDLRAAKSVYRHAQDTKYAEAFDDLDAEANLTPIIDDSIDDSAPIDTTIMEDNAPIDESPMPSKGSNSTKTSRPSPIASSFIIKGQTIAKPVDTLFDEIAKSDNLSNALSKNEPTLFTKRNDNNTVINLTLKEYINGLAKEQITRIKDAMQQRVDTLNKLSQNELNDLALVPYAKSLDIFFHGLANEVSSETRSTLFNIVQTSVVNELSKLNKNVKVPYSSIIYSLGDTYTKKSISDTMMNKETSTLSTTNALFNDNNTNRYDSNTLDSTHKLLSSGEAREPYHLAKQFERVAPKSYVGYDYKSYYPRMRKRAGIFDKIKFSLTNVKAPNGAVIENPYTYFTTEIESELEELVEVIKEDGTVTQERRKTGEKVKRSMLDNTPHYRLIYNIFADPENKTIEFENNEYTMAMMDFTLVQAAGSGQLESMMVKHKASGEEAARMFGRDPEDCTPEQLAALANLVNKQGTSMQRVASYLGRQCLQNMGLVRSGNGFDKEYDRIAVGLGMHMLTYGNELGLFKLNQYKLRVSKNGTKVAVEGVPSALLTLFNADSLTLLKPLGKDNRVLDDLKLEWEGHIDTNGQLIGDGLNKFERERSEVTKQFYGRPPKHRLSETLYVKNTKRTNTVGMTQKEFVFKNRDNMEWKLDMEMARDIVANANAFRRFSGYKFDSTGTKSITEVETEAKLLTMNARTKYEGINSAIDRQIEALETCIKELDEIAANGGTDKNQAIYFENFVSRNARYFIDSTEMNPQTNKIQRFCCTPKGSWHKQNLVNPTAQEQAEEYFCLAQAFDRVKATDEQIEEEGKILTALDVSKTEALLKAFHEAKSTDDFTDKAKEITGLELGMETPAQAYSAIRHLVRRAKAVSKHQKDFDTNLMVENDATTSGYAVRFANMPSPNLMTDDRNYLEKVGLFHFDNEEQFQQWLKDHGAEGDEHAITMHVIKAQKGFQDIYRTAASDLSVDINELNETNAKKLIKDKISKAVKYGYEKHAKKAITDDSPEMDAAVQSMYDVFEKLKPALPTAEKTDEVDQNGNPIYKIDGYLRELMKDPTMVFGYSAGAKSISRKVAANLLDEYSDYFMMVKNEYGNIKGYTDSHAATKEQALKENKVYDKNYKKVIASWDAFTELEKKSGLNLAVAMQRKFFADIWFKQGERKVNLARYFEDMIGATYGDAIGEILEAQYKEFVHINNMAIWVTTSMYQMYVDRRAKGIKRLLEKYSNGKIPLSEINALTKELEDAYPYVKLASNQIGENNQPDSRLDLIKDRRQIDSTTQVQNYVVNANGQLENNMTGYGESIVPAPPGRSGAVLLTHGLDSHEIMYTGKVVPLVPINMVHDALVMSAYQQLYATRGYNESTLVLGDAYSIFGQIVENFERCCEAELQARYKEENALNDPQAQQRIKEAFYSETLKNDRGETIKASEYNRRAHPSESNLLDNKEPMTRQYLSERIHVWNGIINNWREAFYGNGSVVYCCNCDGVRGTGFAYRRTQNDQVARAEEAFKKFEGQNYYRTSGSTYAGFKTDGELKILHQQAISDPKARVEILHSLNNLAKDTDELVVSDEFMKELEDLIANANPHALKNSVYELIENGRFTAGEVTIQNTGEARIRVFMDDKQHTDMVTKRAIESQMAPAEIFAHEIEHAVLHPAFTMTDALGFRPQMQELNGYYEIARELTKPEDFMIEGDYDPNLRDLYKKHAQHSYDYFFNNSDIAGNRGLFEWAALIRTSEKFRNILTQRFAEKHGEKPATKFIDKLINLIKSITDVLFRRKSLVEAFPKIFGSTTARAKAQGLQFLDEIDNIIDTMARANNKAIKKLDTHPAKSKENFFKFLGMWVLNHNRPLGQWLKKHTIDLAKTMGWDKKAASQKIPLSGSFFDTAKLYASTTLMYPISPEHRKMWRELLTRVFKVSQQGILFSLARDMSKPDFNSSLLEFQALRSKDADTMSKQIEHLTRLNLEGGFDRKLNIEERVSLTHAYLYTDAQCLLPHGFDYIKKTMLDDTFVNNEIQKRIDYIKKHFKNDRDYYWIVSQCVSTARFMITGQGNEQLNTNAYGIAIGNFYDNKIEFTEENYKNINELITLYAIQNTDADQKLLATSLNQAGLENFLNTHKEFVDESINGVKTDDMDMSKTTKIIEPIHVMKGYTKQLIDTTYETQIALVDPDSQKMMRNQGFKLVQKIYPNDVTKHEYVLGIYKRYGIPKRRDGAAFNLIGYHAMGSTLESMSYKDVLTLSTDEDAYDSAALAEKRIQLSEMYKRNADVKSAKLRERMTRGPMTFEDFDKLSYGFSPIASPLGSSKAIADYRITMSLDNKRKIFGLEEDGIETLSKMFASMNKKAKASAANKALVEFLIEDMNKNMNPNTHLGKHGKAYNYIKLSEFTDNKYLQEAWRVLPKELKEAMQKQEIWVREDWLQNLFGVANMSLNDTWLVKKIPSYYLKRLIGVAEMILKTIAYYRKQSIVLKIPGVLIGNIVSNFMFSVVNHANPLKVLKLTILNAKAIREYLNTKKQLNTIILKQRLGTATNAEIASKNMLRTRLQNNMVHPLMEMGMYQSIVEDLNPEELESTSKLTKMLKHNKLVEKIPPSLKNITKHLYIAEGTPLYDFMFTATQYSDFIARATEYQLTMEKQDKVYKNLMKSKPTPENERYFNGKEGYERFKKDYRTITLMRVLNAFINYDKPQSKGEQYLNDIGALMFSKFAKRIQHVIAEQLWENPLGALAFLLSQHFLVDTEDIFEQNVFNKNWSALFNTPWDNFQSAVVPMPLQILFGNQKFMG